ncbi:MAG TPA: adenylate/guanylate cyclase domain-containing protein [Marmoricola sp.]|nr:adenylate/guanylate cyclase domain-containing protein [Marmoricola sp.]
MLIALCALLAIVAAGLGFLLARSHRALRAMTAERDELLIEVRRRLAPGPSSRRGANTVRAIVETAVESAARFREGGVSGLLSSSIEDLVRWTTEDRRAIAQVTGPDGTVTILFSDIENSTSLNEQLGDKGWVALLSAHDALVEQAVADHGGVVVKTQGDGFMVVFGDCVAAVRAAVEIQRLINTGAHRRLRRTPIRVREGLHVGPVVHKDGDFFGTNVAMAARVAAQAIGGHILVSDAVHARLADNPDAEDLQLIEAFKTELKGLEGTHQLWEVQVL